MDDEINIADICTQCTSNDIYKILKKMKTVLSTRITANKFPGSHPVTLLKKHIPLLLNNNYLVCEKSDGVRAFLYSFSHTSKNINIKDNTNQKEKSYSFFIDRTNTVYFAPLYMDISADTILDGELYYDTINGKRYLVFAVFDCLLANGVNCLNFNFVIRLDYAWKMVARIKCDFKVKVKHMYKSYGFCEVFNNISSLNHKNDGMIFTPVDEPCKLGRCDTLLKWKPAHLNTVDFLIKKAKDFNYVYELHCYCKGTVMDIFDYFINIDEEKSGCVEGEYDNLIGEFYYDANKVTYDCFDFDEIVGGWKLLRIRRDKNTPNSCKVIVNVINSIKENIGYKDLEIHFQEMKNNWKNREMANNSK